MNRPPRIGEIVCDCRYKHLAVTWVSNYYPEDDEVELEDGFHCSWVHCLDEVPHEWSHENPVEINPRTVIPEDAFNELLADLDTPVRPSKLRELMQESEENNG